MQHLTCASSALGERREIHVFIYDTTAQLRQAAHRFNGATNPDDDDIAGATQVYCGGSEDRSTIPIVRLARTHLTTRYISHEMHHATTAIYGDHIAARPTRRAHFNHYNEPFAYLYSDMLSSLVNQLHHHGYYDQTKP